MSPTMPDHPGYEQIVLEQIYEQAERRAKAMADQMGKPPGTKDMNDDREVREWLRDDESIDVDVLLEAGKTIEEITRAKHSVRVRMIEQHSPDRREQCLYARKMKQKATEYQARQSHQEMMAEPYKRYWEGVQRNPLDPFGIGDRELSELDAMGPVEAPETNGAGYE